MKYLKYYETVEEYNEDENGKRYVTSTVPCVAYINELKDDSRYNKELETLTVVYNVTSTGATKIFNTGITKNLKEVIVDHDYVPASSLTTNYVFSEPGIHTIMYRYSELSSIPDNAFSSCPSIIHVAFSDSVESTGSYMFSNCAGVAKTKPIVFTENIETLGTATFMLNNGTNPVRYFVFLRETPPSIGDRCMSVYYNGAYRANNARIYVKYSEDHHILDSYRNAGGKWSPYTIRELNEDGSIPS